MKIIGCDLHAAQQTIAMLDRETGEIVETTLKHEAGTVREFTRPCRHRSWSGSKPPAPWDGFCNCSTNSASRYRVDIRRRSEGRRKQKHDRRDAALLLRLLSEDRFPAIWIPSTELGSAGLVAAPAPVGASADAGAECAARDRARVWRAARTRAVESRRPGDAGDVAVATARRASSRRTAGVVSAVG